MSSPLPPWHLWGSSTTISLIPGVRSTPFQLARIAYARPETWSFFFSARLVGAPFDAVERSMQISFDVLAGVGRGVVDTNATESVLDSLCLFELYLAGGADISSAQMALASAVPRKLVQGPAAATAPVVTMDKIVAQDLQCGVRGFMSAGSVGPVQVEVGAFFAPVAHVRPEWFAGRFPGDEEFGK